MLFFIILSRIVVKSGERWQIVAFFMGEYNNKVDAKGRIIIPSKFREKLGENFVVTKGLDKCLYVYDASSWSSIQEKLAQMPILTADARTVRRMMVGSAVESDTDATGRVLISAPLRSYASIDKEAVLIGNIDHIEIWSRENWDKASEIDADDAAEKLYNSGIQL